jgi:hypothetical protein
MKIMKEISQAIYKYEESWNHLERQATFDRSRDVQSNEDKQEKDKLRSFN